MERRTFITASVAGSMALGIGGAALWVNDGVDPETLSIESALTLLNGLDIAALTSTGPWNLYQIFSHAAQSVEYSMTGYPEHKSDVFKHTVGYLAFAAFSKKGKMMHGLSEPIPGAPLISPLQDTATALARLTQSLKDFQQYEGPLAPHFAYGVLTKAEYAQAHVMHVYNHFDEIQRGDAES